jgi:TPR repeat protein
MTVARTNRSWSLVGLVVASVLCVVVAVGVTRWPEIQFELGYAYESGNFHGARFSKNNRKAAYWLVQAAQSNHPRAQYMVGILYAQGVGLPRDSAQAAEWFTRSARNGYGPACYHLGWMHHKGDGVPRDDELAIRLLEQAAGQGMAAAQLALGRFYEHGEGVSEDVVQALKWYALAVHFTRSRPDLFDNAAFAERAQAACDALASQVAPSSEKQGCPQVAG